MPRWPTFQLFFSLSFFVADVRPRNEREISATRTHRLQSRYATERRRPAKLLAFAHTTSIILANLINVHEDNLSDGDVKTERERERKIKRHISTSDDYAIAKGRGATTTKTNEFFVKATNLNELNLRCRDKHRRSRRRSVMARDLQYHQ